MAAPAGFWKRLREEPQLRLGELALALDKIQPDEIRHALETQASREPHRPLGQILIEEGALSTADCARLLLEQERLSRSRILERVDKFLLLHELGRGGMGVVFRAWDSLLERPVALKMLRGENRELHALILREARMAAKLAHPNIVPVYEVLEYEGKPYIAMGLVEGKNLADASREIPLRTLLEKMRDVARAVHHAHQQSIIHRDLKPENLMVDREGKVFVLDFGLAKTTNPGATISQSGAVIGTPAFMPPEQAMAQRDRVGPRSDVYSLGATLYTLIAGQPPFLGKSGSEVLMKVLHQEPLPLRKLRPNLDRDIETIVLRAMEKEPSRRYEDAAALAEDVDRYLRGTEIIASPPSLLRKIPRRTTAVGAVVVLAVVASIVAWRATRREAARTRAMPHLEEARGALEEANRYLYRETPKLEGMWDLLSKGKAAIARALREDDTLPEAYFLRAQYHEFEGNPGAAEADYTRALEVNPDFALCRIRRALYRLHRRLVKQEMLQDIGSRSEVAAEWGSEARMSEKDLAYAKVGLLIVRKDYSEAKRVCAEALERFETEDLLRLQALAHLEMGSDRDAKASLERAVKLKYYDGYARITLAILAFEAGDLASVDPHLEIAGKVLLHEPELFTTRGVALMARGEFEAAAAAFTRALELNPESTTAYRNRSGCWMKLGRAEDALADNAKAIELYRTWGKAEKEAEALLLRGKHLSNFGRYPEALEDFAAAERLAPAWAEVPLTRGCYYLWKSRELDRAQTEFERATELDSKSAEAWLRLGQTRANLSQFQAALPAYDQAVSLAPQDARGYAGRGSCRTELGELEAGLGDLDRAIELDREDPFLWVVRARVRRLRNDFAEADGDLKEALRLDATNASAYLERAQLALARGDWPRLEAEADQARRYQEESRSLSSCLAFRGWARFAQGRAEEARNDFEEAFRSDPRNPDAFFFRGLSRQANDPGAAAEDFERVVEILPRHSKAWMNLGVTRARVEKTAEASFAFSKAIDLQPKWALALAYRARARLALGETDGAGEDAERAVTAEPNLPEAHHVRGLVRKREGDLEGALQGFARSLELDPSQSSVRADRGLLLAELRRDSEALTDLEQVVKEQPDREPELRSILRELRSRVK